MIVCKLEECFNEFEPRLNGKPQKYCSLAHSRKGANRKWRQTHKEEAAASAKKWRDNNPDKVAAIKAAKRRSRPEIKPNQKLPGATVIVQLYSDGWEIAEIARRYDTSVSGVWSMLKCAGVELLRKCKQCTKLFPVHGRTDFCSEACLMRSKHERLSLDPVVYAMHFPSVGKLKIGYASTRHYIGGNRGKAKRIFGATDGASIWTKPGDYRHESFVQVSLSFRYAQPAHANTRICEWFDVPDKTEAELVTELDSIFSTIFVSN